AGVTAMALVTFSVILGLAVAGRVTAPARARVLRTAHEQLALTGLGAIGVHGLTLLGDRWIHAGPASLGVPFLLPYRPLWTGLGVVAAWLAALLGLSYYARRRIGARRWRSLHRATLLVYVLGLAHVIGAGTDAASAWLRLPLLGSIVPVGA